MWYNPLIKYALIFRLQWLWWRIQLICKMLYRLHCCCNLFMFAYHNNNAYYRRLRQMKWDFLRSSTEGGGALRSYNTNLNRNKRGDRGFVNLCWPFIWTSVGLHLDILSQKSQSQNVKNVPSVTEVFFSPLSMEQIISCFIKDLFVRSSWVQSTFGSMPPCPCCPARNPTLTDRTDKGVKEVNIYINIYSFQLCVWWVVLLIKGFRGTAQVSAERPQNRWVLQYSPGEWSTQ